MYGARVLVAKIRTAATDQFSRVVVRHALFRIAVALTTKIGFLRALRVSTRRYHEHSTYLALVTEVVAELVECVPRGVLVKATLLVRNVLALFLIQVLQALQGLALHVLIQRQYLVQTGLQCGIVHALLAERTVQEGEGDDSPRPLALNLLLAALVVQHVPALQLHHGGLAQCFSPADGAVVLAALLRTPLAAQTRRTHGLVLHTAARMAARELFVAADEHTCRTVLLRAHQAVTAQCVLGTQRCVAESTVLRLEVHRVLVALVSIRSDVAFSERRTCSQVNPK